MVVLNLLKGNEGLSAFSGKTYEVQAGMIQLKDISSSIIVTGQVEVIFDQPVMIEEVYVKKGDHVKVGDQLMALDMDSLEQELTQLELNYQIGELQLEKMKALATTTDTTSLEIAIELNTLSLASAQSFYEAQKENYEKNLILFNENVISQSELDSYQKMMNDAYRQL